MFKSRLKSNSKLLIPIFILAVLMLQFVPAQVQAYHGTAEFRTNLIIDPANTNISKDGDLRFSVNVAFSKLPTGEARDVLDFNQNGMVIEGLAVKDFNACPQERVSGGVIQSCENLAEKYLTLNRVIKKDEQEVLIFVLSKADRDKLGVNNSSASGVENAIQIGMRSDELTFTSTPILEVKYKVFDASPPQGSAPIVQGPTSAVMKIDIAPEGTGFLDPNNINVGVSMPNSIYRAVRGQPINIPVTVTSDTPIKVGDRIDRVLGNPPIDGFYVASVGRGVTDPCGRTGAGGCNFEENTGSAVTMPFQVTLQLNTADTDIYPASGSAKDARELLIFPVLDIRGNLLSTVDFPFTDNAATVTIEIYKNLSDFQAAATAAGTTVDGFKAGGAAINLTTSGTETKGSVFGYILDPIGGGMLSIVNWILTLVVGLLRMIVWALATYIVLPILEVTLSMDAANIASTIQFGWSFVRDIVNMLFILVLIILGFATILRIESYNYRHILVELIIMAVLVNFSLVIARIIIQVADLVQFTFLPQGEGIAGVRYLFKVLTIDQVSVAVRGFSWSTAGALASTASILFQFVLELGVVITFAALAVYTLIRIVALWILMILSPFAYALRVLPATHHQAEEWWHNFLKYAFFTPIMAFFLRLTIELHHKGLTITSGTVFADKNSQALTADITTYLAQQGATSKVPLSATFELIIVYLVVLAFMWGGIIVASKLGIYGADVITDFAKKGLAAPFAAGAWATKGLAGLGMRVYSGAIARRIGLHKDEATEAKDAAKALRVKAKGLREAGKLNEAADLEQQARVMDSKKRAHAAKSGWYRFLSFLNPHVAKEAWHLRKEELDERSYKPAIGHMQDTFKRIIPTEWANPFSQKFMRGQETFHGLYAERELVDAEASARMKGVRTREDAAKLLAAAVESGERDEIMAAFKVLLKGNWDDDFENIEGHTYTPLHNLQHKMEIMKNAGFTRAETMTILNDLKETAEAEGRRRHYGITAMDPDGIVRAVTDYEYYESLSRDNQAKELAKLADDFDVTAKDTNDPDFAIAAATFKTAAEDVRSGRANLHEVLARQVLFQEISPESMEDVWSSARFDKEAAIKLRRGPAATHLRGREAAIFLKQDPTKGWHEYTFLGKQILHHEPLNIKRSLQSRPHESQGRQLVPYGIFQDKTGSWKLPDMNLVPTLRAEAARLEATRVPENIAKAEELNEAADLNEQNYRIAVQAIRLDRSTFEATAMASTLGFSEEERTQFRDYFNANKARYGLAGEPDLELGK